MRRELLLRRTMHLHGCDCAECTPPRPFLPSVDWHEPSLHPRLRDAGVNVGAWIVAGFGGGIALTWLVDHLTGGPGLGVMFGW